MPMKLSTARNIALTATAIGILPACGIGGYSSSGGGSTPVIVIINNRPASIPQGTTYTFTATTSGTTGNIRWALPYSYASGVGSISPSTGSPVTYTAPSSPPLYNNIPGAIPGMVTIAASDVNSGKSDTATFVITSPSVTVSASPTAATVPLGGTVLINAYAIGSINNGLTAQVNGVTGGSTATGTIAPAAGYGNFQYNAPSTLPMSGNTVTVTILSQADPTKSASTVIILH